ncbi:AI-2E family transporter [Bacillus taeanensis]|uniref:AI-2E family transporter n=1 Tax=Bacillus taeanensis TaxID=273032 RepID=A0A366XY08_9BACI|nr:AI-2E family transporter [Bacillus taeanensis]RBW70448.1 AI-2E family transporter [Bacillus taeanensis]
MKKDQFVPWLIRLTVLLLIFLCSYMFLKLAPIWEPVLKVIITLLVPFFIAGFITYLLHPIIEKLHQRHIPRWLAILLIYLLFFGGVGFSVVKGLSHIIKQLQELAVGMPDLFEIYHNWIRMLNNQTSHLPPFFHTRIEQTLVDLENTLNQSIDSLIAGIKELLNGIFVLIVVPFLVFYLLKDFESVKRTAWYITPKQWRKHACSLLKQIDESLGHYIRGQLLVITILMIVAALSLWAIGMPYPILLGVIIGITDIIPYFGPILGALPAVFIAAAISIKKIFLVAGIVLFLQFLEGNVLSPLIVGKSLHMHPIFIIFALLVGEEVGGIFGMIVAVPILAVIRVLFVYFRTYRTKH